MAILDRPAAADRPHAIASPPGTGGEATLAPERILMKGNEAIAEAAIAAGCDAYFGYPITPQAELLEWMARRMPEEGRAFVQAESELAAINMALGAGAAGARVLVSSSSPGISLMAEAMSYMAGSRVPCVLINVMRGGPGLGSHRRRPGRLPPGDEGPRPRRLPGARARALVDRRGHRARRPRVRPRRAVPDAGHDPRRRHPGPGDGAGLHRSSRACRASPPTGSSRARRAASRASCARCTSSPKTSRSTTTSSRRRTARSRSARPAGRAKSSTTPRSCSSPTAPPRGSPAPPSSGREPRVSGSGCSGRSRCGRSRSSGLRSVALGARAVLAVELSAGQLVEDVRLAMEGDVPVFHHGRTGGMVPTPDEVVAAARRAWATTPGLVMTGGAR